MTSDPADKLILSSQRPPLSLLFTSQKEKEKEEGEKRGRRNNEAGPGGDEKEGEEKPSEG